MNELSTITAADTPVKRCPTWCQNDHEAGGNACQTERRSVVRVPEASTSDASSVHAFQIGEGSVRLAIGGEFFTVTAAREYAAKITETCDSVTQAIANDWPTNVWAIFRRAHGLSQEEVAAAVGTSRSQISKIETDRRQLFDFEPLYTRMINFYATAPEVPA
jgi:DNA-binding transcriptional regulator YiaG